MPNGLAYLALLLWPVVCVLLFRKYGLRQGMIWSFLGGYLFLPPVAAFNMPLLPDFDKTIIPSLSVVFACMWVSQKKVNLLPENRIAQALLLIYVVGSIATVFANGDPIIFSTIPDAYPIVFQSWSIRGLGIRDLAAGVGNQAIALLPFLLARQFLSSEKSMHAILYAFVVSGLVYSIPALIEIRLSPQMNTWVYGFFQHDFSQTVRAGGYRPLVFLPHGLWMALYVLFCMLSAAALTRDDTGEIQPRMMFATLYLFALLILCKSLGSLVYGLLLLPLVLFTSSKVHVRVAVVFAAIAVVYPMLRGMGLIPTEWLLAVSDAISPDRSASLGYRFNNEDQLLARAAEKTLLGWGGWGRNLVHDVFSGEILTIPDGRWIIAFGTYGWSGYIAEFGLLSLPIFLLGRETLLRKGPPVSRHAAALCLILGINMIDLLVNATLTPLSWILAGAVLGYAEQRSAERRREKARARDQRAPIIGAVGPMDGPRTVL